MPRGAAPATRIKQPVACLGLIGASSMLRPPSSLLKCCARAASLSDRRRGPSLTARFSVVSGTCTLAEGGRCVGFPNGYQTPNNQHQDSCVALVVGSTGGVLGPCPSFELSTHNGWDGGADSIMRHGNGDCPVGTAMEPGDTFSQHSRAPGQGGRWQICFDDDPHGKGSILRAQNPDQK